MNDMKSMHRFCYSRRFGSTAGRVHPQSWLVHPIIRVAAATNRMRTETLLKFEVRVHMRRTEEAPCS